MRVFVMFDLPTETKEERRDYSRFRKYLIKSGFIMMQESIYCKMCLNTTSVNTITSNIRKNKPNRGLVQMLTITERQFSKMEMVLGQSSSEILDSDERLVIL